jgi:8-oxo-dGTP pyrophosphatase MutT (NUDIX family)
VAPLRAIVRKLKHPSPKTELASAVAVRERDAGGVEFLLVRTSSGERWTFPKGRREHGETLAEAAAREAVEEAGVRGRAEREPFAHYRYPSRGGGWDVVAAFRLRVEREGLPAEPGREPAWFGLEAARSKLAAGRDGSFGEQMERVLTDAQQGAAR